MTAPLLLLAALCALGWLSIRFGHDSTQSEPLGPEEALARRGMTWSFPAPARPDYSSSGRQLRQAVRAARQLRADEVRVEAV